MFAVFSRPKPCRVMSLLRDGETQWHLSKIAKSADASYVYIYKLIQKLEKAGLVGVESSGKKRVVRLTEKGMKVASAIDELRMRLEG